MIYKGMVIGINLHGHYLVHTVLIFLFSLVIIYVKNFHKEMLIINIRFKSIAGKINILLIHQMEGLNKDHIINILKKKLLVYIK